TTILDLNQFCFFELFQQIKKNCEKNNENIDDVKYADLINFLISLKPIRKFFEKWDRHLSRRLSFLFDTYNKEIIIDFEEKYQTLGRCSKGVRNNYYKLLCSALKENDFVSKVHLIYKPESYHSEHMEVFDSVMQELRWKKSVKILIIEISGYTLDDLTGFENLEELHLSMRVDVDKLVKYLERNPGLVSLSVTDEDSVGSRLANITQYCQFVKSFSLVVKGDIDATQYVPLARMPQLKNMRISGQPEPGTLQLLLRELAHNDKTLKSLEISHAELCDAEAEKLSKYTKIVDLSCKLKDPESIRFLTKLTSLKRLQILSEHPFPSISKYIQSILTKQGRGEVKIFLPNCLIEYEDNQHMLLFLNHAKASDYVTLLTGTLTVLSLKLKGFHAPGTLCQFLEGLAATKVVSFTYDRINRCLMLDHDYVVRAWKLKDKVENFPVLNSEEIAALSKCKTLKTVCCGLADTHNIELLARLSNLEKLKITTKPAGASLYRLLRSLGNRRRQTLRSFELQNGSIGFLEYEELLRISTLIGADYNFSDDDFTELPANLSCEEFELLQKPTLQKYSRMSREWVRILERSKKPNAIRGKDIQLHYNPRTNWLTLVLKVDKGFTEGELLILLASLEWQELQVDWKQCSLQAFLRFSSKRTQNHVKKIAIKAGSLNFDETLELSKFPMLEHFEGDLTDPQSLEHFKSFPHIKYINLNHFSFNNIFPPLIAELFDSVSGDLVVELFEKEVTFTKNEGLLTLKSAYLKAFYVNANYDIVALANIQDLRSIRICGRYIEGSLQPFFAQLASRQNQTVRELRIDPDHSINTAEVEAAASIQSLEVLECGFQDARNLEVLSKMPRLTALTITNHLQGSLKGLLEGLNSKKSPTLECLRIEQKELITPEELEALGSI
ncbi:hypothetical protein KR074_011314, partial [Drosophila pseudoananassae]